MQKREEDKLSMYHSVLNYHEHNVQLVQPNAALQNAYTAFKAVVAAINSTSQRQISATKGHAINKADNKAALSNFGNEIAGALFAWASDNNDTVTKEKVRITFSGINRLRDEEVANLCTLYYDIAHAHQIALVDYGLTKEVLDTYKQAIDNYQNLVPAPRNATAMKSADRVKLSGLFKEADALLKNKIDKLSLPLKKTNPDYVEAYKFNRRIVNSGTNATGLRMMVKDAKTGKAIVGATIHIEALQLTVVTDKEGEAVVRPVPKGKHNITVDKEGYQAQTISEQKATVGKTTVVEVLLKQ